MKIRKTRSLLTPLAATVLLALPLSASAVPITGAIGFGGAFLPTGGSGLDDATGIDFLSAFALAGTDDYAGIPALTGVSFTDFQFAPLSPAPVVPLWELSFGGIDYSFDLYDINVDFQTVDELNLSGTGILMATGFDDTSGMWTFSGDAGGQIVFTFSSVSAAMPVPEPASLLLMMLGLAAIGFSRQASRRVCWIGDRDLS